MHTCDLHFATVFQVVWINSHHKAGTVEAKRHSHKLTPSCRNAWYVVIHSLYMYKRQYHECTPIIFYIRGRNVLPLPAWNGLWNVLLLKWSTHHAMAALISSPSTSIRWHSLLHFWNLFLGDKTDRVECVALNSCRHALQIKYAYLVDEEGGGKGKGCAQQHSKRSAITWYATINTM